MKMNTKKLSLASIATAVFVLAGCPSDDTSGTGGTDTDDPTTMTATMTASSTMTGPSTTDPTTGPSTTDPDTTVGETDPTGDTDTDTTGPDPDAFDFRDDDPSAYTRVDRMGFPAVLTGLIASENEDAYNAANPTNDVAGDFLADIAATLDYLHAGTGGSDGNGLNDELVTAAGILEADVSLCNHPGTADPNDTCVSQGGPFVFPDVITVNTSADTGFPNGRGLAAPVVDIILAVLLLDVHENDPGTGAFTGFNVGALLLFADLDPATEGNQGLSQSDNDLPFNEDFPYLAPAHK